MLPTRENAVFWFTPDNKILLNINYITCNAYSPKSFAIPRIMSQSTSYYMMLHHVRRYKQRLPRPAYPEDELHHLQLC